ncbi:MAG: Holliday junction branch migration protein RuvA [Xanthomonadales bacterium]|nr:Holliday junction branch migration protein RuvA [Xanthomonadales bacterium]MCB1595016.1 Holliday junction branch migration protein RuvA [Xanthomonadales bacterium]MCB1604115.1 Holliday junction branch migration protein RuvA [Xanthomonadales bacterium]
MIGQIKGQLIRKDPPIMVVDAGGVGYEIEAPVRVFFELPEINSEVTIITHLLVREDAQILYGFNNYQQRELFRKLLKVNGVGAKSALAILSTFSTAEFAGLIQSQDVVAITKIPGVGKKTAERLIVEMRDKLGDFSGDISLVGSQTASVANLGSMPATAQSEALIALQSLGFKPQEVNMLIKNVAKDGMSAEEIIRLCLQHKGAS